MEEKNHENFWKNEQMCFFSYIAATIATNNYNDNEVIIIIEYFEIFEQITEPHFEKIKIGLATPA